MGDKYIIELEEKPFHDDNGDFLYRVKGFNSLVFDMTGIGKLTPYTEPDLEQVREEAYKNGYDAACKDIDIKSKTNAAYQKGLEDAWKVADKIFDMSCLRREQIFSKCDSVGVWDILRKYSASEAIEKIRQYEQGKEEIKVGDEVKNTQTGVKFIVTHLWENNRGEQGVSGFNQKCSAFSTTIELVKKTGRHFPEIAEVLNKIKEG